MAPALILAVLFHTGDLPELAWPLEGSITSEYGPRHGQLHEGIDIGAEEGTWIRSSADGLVVYAGEYGNYGNFVSVKHGENVRTYYAHLQNFCVFKWQRIKRGQKIGRVGTTGRTTGPHLHFEIHISKAARDPLGLLPPRQVIETDVRELAVGGP